jgi:cytochrome bd ubiquinol oxidase subunit II
MIISAPSDYREAARRRLPRFLFDYIDGGAVTENTMRSNAAELQKIPLRQRVLQGVGEPSLGTEILGSKWNLPIALGPVGALVEGLPVANGQYVGGDFGWLSPFALLCGVGLCLGYALLGACWLVKKCEGDIREEAYRLIPYLAGGLLIFLLVVFVYALTAHFAVMDRWLQRPYLLVFPLVGVVAMARLAHGIKHRRDGVPFAMVALTFAAAFGTLAVSFWPYMIPFSITIDDAAAPHTSLAFMFWGEGLFVFPLMLVYAAVNYAVFRGKVQPAGEHY